MSQEPETVHPVPATRRERRAQASSRRPVPVVSFSHRPLTLVATIALSALIALSGYAHPFLVGLSVALAGLVLAWGWPALLGLPSRYGSTVVLGLGTVLCVVAATLTTRDPFLQWIPAALAVAAIAEFVHQLLRRDGRPRLAESVTATVAGLAVISSGAGYIPLPRTLGGESPLAAAMAALALSALADGAVTSHRLRRWALPIAMVLGAGGATAVALATGRPLLATAALLGVLVAGVAHATRRLLAILPSMVSARSQLVSAAASVLLCGVVVYVVSRVVVA